MSMAAKSLNSTACLEILALTAAFETSTLLAPCAHNVSFHFPNRLLLLAAFGGSCSLLLLNSCRKNCCCLLPFFSNICVVTAAVAWHFGSHTGTLHIEKKEVAHEHEKKNLRRERKKSGTVMQSGGSVTRIGGKRDLNHVRVTSLEAAEVPAMRTCFIGRF